MGRHLSPVELSRVIRAFLVWALIWLGVLVYALVQFYDGQQSKE